MSPLSLLERAFLTAPSVALARRAISCDLAELTISNLSFDARVHRASDLAELTISNSSLDARAHRTSDLAELTIPNPSLDAHVHQTSDLRGACSSVSGALPPSFRTEDCSAIEALH